MSLEIVTIIGGPIQTNAYLVADTATGDALVIDAPYETASQIVEEAARRGWTIGQIVITHTHLRPCPRIPLRLIRTPVQPHLVSPVWVIGCGQAHPVPGRRGFAIHCAEGVRHASVPRPPGRPCAPGRDDGGDAHTGWGAGGHPGRNARDQTAAADAADHWPRQQRGALRWRDHHQAGAARCSSWPITGSSCPADPLPGTPRAEEPLPLVIFVHGSGAIDADPYLAWIEHLVRRGAVVLYPVYQGTTAAKRRTGRPCRMTCAAACDAGAGGCPGRPDPGGGGRSLARRRVGGGLRGECRSRGTPGADSGDERCSQLPVDEVACLGADLGAIPATTRLLLVTEADDPDPRGRPRSSGSGPGLGRAAGQPGCGAAGHGRARRPPLCAVHIQALAGHEVGDPPDAFDWYGTWKWLDALMSCAFAGEWCEYALGNTPEQRFMGEWSDGVPVTEAVVTDDPATQALPEIDVAAQVMKAVRDAGSGQGPATPGP